MQTRLYVVAPQAFRVAVPLLTSIFSALFRNTALVSAIGVTELLAAADRIQQQNFQTFELFAVAGMLYLSLTLPLAWASSRLEHEWRGHDDHVSSCPAPASSRSRDWPIWRFLLEGLWLSVRIAGISIMLSLRHRRRSWRSARLAPASLGALAGGDLRRGVPRDAAAAAAVLRLLRRRPRTPLEIRAATDRRRSSR